MDEFICSYGFVVSEESLVEDHSFRRIYARGRRYIVLSAGNYPVDYPWFWQLTVTLKANRLAGISFERWKKAKFGKESEYLTRFHFDTDDCL